MYLFHLSPIEGTVQLIDGVIRDVAFGIFIFPPIRDDLLELCQRCRIFYSPQFPICAILDGTDVVDENQKKHLARS